MQDIIRQLEEKRERARKGGGQAEHEDLEGGHIIAGETHPVFLGVHGHQDATELAVLDKPGHEQAHEQQAHAHEVQDGFGLIGADVPAHQGLQIGNAVYTPGVALLTNDQNGQDGCDGLGDDGEVDAPPPGG